MANWYVNSASGSDTTGNGTTGTPYKTVYKALTVWGNGDTIYCTNDVAATPEVLTAAWATIAVSSLTATNKIIGVNSSWVDDGTLYKVNGDSAVASCVTFIAALFKFKNLEIYGCTSHGVNAGSNSGGAVYENCVFRNNGGSGVNMGTNALGTLFYRCKFHNNTGRGLSSGSTGNPWVKDCTFYANGSDAISLINAIYNVHGCVLRDNTGWAIVNGSSGVTSIGVVTGCVIDGNAGALRGSSSTKHVILGCRITNNTNRFDTGTGSLIYEDFNFSLTNGSDTGSGVIENLNGKSLTEGTEGYVDRVNKNFALTRSASNISVAQLIGGTTGMTTAYITSGLPRIEPTLPAITDVKTGIQYGDSGTELTGTLVSGGGSAVIGSSIIKRG